MKEKSKKWLDKINESRWPLPTLFVASFLETILIPIPIEVVLVPFMLIRRHQLWLIAFVVTAGCMTAAIVGYGIGLLFFDSLGQWMIEHYGSQESFEEFKSIVEQYGFWGIIAVGVIPIPFQIAFVGAGISGYSFVKFLLAATIARSIRYYGLALLVHFFGERAEEIWRERRKTAFAIVAALLLAIFALVQWGLPALRESLSGGGT